MHNLRYAIRYLWMHKSFTCTAVLTLAIGLGANTALYGMLSSTLRPLALPDSEHIVAIAAEAEGSIDLAVGDEKTRSLTVYVNDGRGRLTPDFRVTDPAKTPYAMTAGDLNDDGHPDIVFGYTEGPHAVFFNDGTGRQFRQIAFGDKTGSAYGFAIGDVNGDRIIDIAVARSGAPNVLYLGSK